MVAGRYKSRTLRRKKVKTPGGRLTTHYLKRKPKKAHCAECGVVLSGVPRERPYIMRNLGKTKKRPERPFGGMLCSKCSRDLIKKQARK
ncbi:50S ribosomal protein L34e [Candidatus Woesearchaeota archaeon]|nr:50S ribosomal protein L34e [Candidatus Woesearchaeota archaeon]